MSDLIKKIWKMVAIVLAIIVLLVFILASVINFISLPAQGTQKQSNSSIQTSASTIEFNQYNVGKTEVREYKTLPVSSEYPNIPPGELIDYPGNHKEFTQDLVLGASTSVSEIYHSDRNDFLKNFGYELKLSGEETSDFVDKDGNVLISNIGYYSCFLANERNDRFLFWASIKPQNGDSDRHRPVIIADGKIITDYDSSWPSASQCPIFVGEDILFIESDRTLPAEENKMHFVVKKNQGEVVTQFSSYQAGIIEPIRRFVSYGKNNWLLEYYDGVIINGENLGQKYGYEKAFGSGYRDGKLYYFYQQDDRYGFKIGDQDIPLEYENIFHYGCCEYGSIDPRMYGNGVTFFAVKDGYWYFVVVKEKT